APAPARTGDQEMALAQVDAGRLQLAVREPNHGLEGICRRRQFGTGQLGGQESHLEGRRTRMARAHLLGHALDRGCLRAPRRISADERRLEFQGLVGEPAPGGSDAPRYSDRSSPAWRYSSSLVIRSTSRRPIAASKGVGTVPARSAVMANAMPRGLP